MSKIKELYQKYKEIINYLIFGVLTTVVSLVTYYICVFTVLDPDNAIQLQSANVISWIISVAFAYITNRKFVFESNEENKIKEATKFVTSRIATLLMDMVIMCVGVTTLKFNDKIMKLVSQVVVIVMNYILSKLIVFKKKSQSKMEIRSKLIKLMTICFSIVFLIALLNTIFFNRTTQINYSVLCMSVLLVVSYILIYIAYKKIQKTEFKKEPTKFQFVIFIVIIFILQIVFAILTFAICGWDCGIVMENAYELVINNDINTYYFSRCPNNIGMLLIATYIIRFISLFGTPTIEQAYLFTIIFNIIIVDISAILTFKVCKKLFGNKICYFSSLFIIPLIMFLPYIIIPYTDTISMVFPILIFYLYIKIKEEKNENKRAFFTILEGMLTILGYHIKPTIVIVVIAICIVEILRCKKIKMINLINIISLFAIGCMISYMSYSYIKNKNLGNMIRKEDYEEYEMPMTHFLKIGLKEVDSGTDLPVKNRILYGTYNYEDVITTMENDGKNAKVKENLKTVKQRLKDYKLTGYMKFLYNKVNWILADGTFFFGQEGSFWTSEHYNKTKLGVLLQQLINNRTNKYQKITANVFQTVWLVILLGLVCSYTKKDENDYLIISKITIIGIVLFLLLFEGRSRYLVNHIPIFIIVGIYGLINSFEKLEEIIRKKQKMISSKGENENE